MYENSPWNTIWKPGTDDRNSHWGWDQKITLKRGLIGSAKVLREWWPKKLCTRKLDTVIVGVADEVLTALLVNVVHEKITCKRGTYNNRKKILHKNEFQTSYELLDPEVTTPLLWLVSEYFVRTIF